MIGRWRNKRRAAIPDHSGVGWYLEAHGRKEEDNMARYLGISLTRLGNSERVEGIECLWLGWPFVPAAWGNSGTQESFLYYLNVWRLSLSMVR